MPIRIEKNGSRLIKAIVSVLTLNMLLLLGTVELLTQDQDASQFRRFQEGGGIHGDSRSLGNGDIAHNLLVLRTNNSQHGSSPLHIKLPREVRSYPNGNSSIHNQEQRRDCLSLTATPKEMVGLKRVVRLLLNYTPYDMFDAIHLCIPDNNYMRFQAKNNTTTSRRRTRTTRPPPPPSTEELQSMFPDPRIILHRLADYGPMTRYVGPLAFERHPETTITILDVDSTDMVALTTLFKKKPRDLTHLVYASRMIDQEAVWCHQGEDFLVNQYNQVQEVWDTFPLEMTPSAAMTTTTMGKNRSSSTSSWCRVDFCRATGGLLFKPKHFANFWWNQTAYHESCFWDDDRWVSYQMERQNFPLKAFHAPDEEDLATWRRRRNTEDEESVVERRLYHGRRLGSLTKVTNKMKSHETCPLAWLKLHPEAYPQSRVTTDAPWILEKKRGKRKP
jgi:hypothetical protein